MRLLLVILIGVACCGCTKEIDTLGGYSLNETLYINGYRYDKVCIDNVQYFQAKGYNGTLTRHYNADGTIKTCGE